MHLCTKRGSKPESLCPSIDPQDKSLGSRRDLKGSETKSVFIYLQFTVERHGEMHTKVLSWTSLKVVVKPVDHLEFACLT